ncbi:MAG: valine--tRNA ligase [Hyphomicrobiales bacterium]|nr:valine--tRNA ligase [Hyphomicrobiales bacterium]
MSEKNSQQESPLAKTFDAQTIEPAIAELWDNANAFAAGAGHREGEESFTIVIPPPNVTGSLHIGHAFNNTLQDILVRFKRMQGKDVLWQPGMDHAGIATQMVVERQLMENQEPNRHALGRDNFIERIWQWKKQSGGLIFNQLRRLGASCDWSRERFTMDEGLSEAVLEVFISLYKEGLIYKDKRLVNWDPKLLTAISDLEVEQIETKGNLWHFKYPLEPGVSYRHPYILDNEGNKLSWRPSQGDPAGYEIRDYLTVATTRPETMLGDTGVAVHPDDPRYQDLVGKHVVLPLVERRIPIVADPYPDPEAGTGAVKMTPAHDFNDFDVGNRNNLRRINILTVDGNIHIKENDDFLEGLESTPELVDLISQLHGQDRFKARNIVLKMMETKGLLAKTENHTHMVPHGDRSGVPIEPFLTDQWYVNAEELAKPAIAAVREGRTSFVPKNWENTYFNWMENIQPWCISRQLWWGHQIPAWYGPDGQIFVEKSEREAQSAADAHYGKSVEINRDPDVLDTWFSSALWPFSTLGWPEKTPELARYYQTDVLITGFDIIFFWVARMMMAGLHFMKDEEGTPIEPFHTVYVHALVRDKNGAKMSKSKGNVVDPLELIDQYGADALRYTLANMAVQGGDVKLDPARVAGFRNFGTKLWNATRFAEITGVKYNSDFKPQDARLTINRWILAELSKSIEEITAKIESYRFNEAASAAYKFVWNSFCDWYLELLKPIFSGEDEDARAESQACAAYVLADIYKLLHPFMPFMTEELWQRTADREQLLCHAHWPTALDSDTEAADEINWLIELIGEIRSVRAEMGIKPSQVMALIITGADDKITKWIQMHANAIARLSRVEPVEIKESSPKGSAQIVIGKVNYFLPLEGIVDFVEERKRLEKELKKLDSEISRLDKKLGNERFVANAPERVVAEERQKLAGYQSQKEKMAVAHNRIKDMS